MTDKTVEAAEKRSGDGQSAPRRRWRRGNSAGKRTHRVEIKLSDEEYARVKAPLRDDLGSARRLMVQVSNNFNQAVRLAHVHELDGSPSPRRFEQDLGTVKVQLEQVIGEVGRIVDEAEAVAGNQVSGRGAR